VKQSPPSTSRPTTSGVETNGEAGKRSRSKSGTPRSARSGSGSGAGAGQANGTGTGNAGAQGPPEIRRESPEGEKNKSEASKVSPSGAAGGSSRRGGSEKRESGAVGSEVGKGVKRDERGEREGSLGEFSLLLACLFVVSVRGLDMNPDWKAGVGEVIEVETKNRTRLRTKGPKEECHVQEAFLARRLGREARSAA
jgi:hypothetical protein